jgi:hypothetical protein
MINFLVSYHVGIDAIELVAQIGADLNRMLISRERITTTSSRSSERMGVYKISNDEIIVMMVIMRGSIGVRIIDHTSNEIVLAAHQIQRVHEQIVMGVMMVSR